MIVFAETNERVYFYFYEYVCSAKMWQKFVHLGRGPRPTHHQQLSWHADNDTWWRQSAWRCTTPQSPNGRAGTIEIPFRVQNSLYLSLKVHSALKSHSGRALSLHAPAAARRELEQNYIYCGSFTPWPLLFHVVCVWSSPRVRPSGLLSTACMCVRARQRGWAPSQPPSKLFPAAWKLALMVSIFCR
jgi:hypothetical protein